MAFVEIASVGMHSFLAFELELKIINFLRSLLQTNGRADWFDEKSRPVPISRLLCRVYSQRSQGLNFSMIFT